MASISPISSGKTASTPPTSSKGTGPETPPLFPSVAPLPSFSISSLLPRAQVDLCGRYGKVERVGKLHLLRAAPYERSLKEQRISLQEWLFMPIERRKSLLKEKGKIIATLREERANLQRRQANLIKKDSPHLGSSYVEEIDRRGRFASLEPLQESIGSSSLSPENPLISPDEPEALLKGPSFPSLEPLSSPPNPPMNHVLSNEPPSLPPNLPLKSHDPLIYLVGDEFDSDEESLYPEDAVEPAPKTLSPKQDPKELSPKIEELFEKDRTIQCLKKENQKLREKVVQLGKNALTTELSTSFPKLRYKQGGHFLRVWLEKDMIASSVCPSTRSPSGAAYTFHGKISFSLAKLLLEGAFSNISLYSMHSLPINILRINDDLSVDSRSVNKKSDFVSNTKIALHDCRPLGAAGISSKLFEYAFVQSLSEPLGSYFLVKKPRAESSTGGILHGRLVSIFETASGALNRSWTLYESEESIGLYPLTFSVIGFLGFSSKEALFNFLFPRLLNSSINFYTISTKLPTLPTVSVFNLALWPPFLEIGGNSSKLVSPISSSGKVGALKNQKRDVG